MIPKKIHYCWFGGKPLPEMALKCIESWKKYCPDYEIIRWDESNFDINCCRYVKEAYENKKWAFVTDYVRLYAMLSFGGIYMDTDVEVLKSLDDFLGYQAFSGFEKADSIQTGIMACEKEFPLFQKLLDDYKDRAFVKEDGSFDLATNVETITNLCLEYGLKLNNEFQIVEGFALFPSDYFCPKNHLTRAVNLTDNTHTIHHFDGSWLPEDMRLTFQKCEKLHKFLPKKFAYHLSRFLAVKQLYGFKAACREVKQWLRKKK